MRFAEELDAEFSDGTPSSSGRATTRHHPRRFGFFDQGPIVARHRSREAFASRRMPLVVPVARIDDWLTAEAPRVVDLGSPMGVVLNRPTRRREARAPYPPAAQTDGTDQNGIDQTSRHFGSKAVLSGVGVSDTRLPPCRFPASASAGRLRAERRNLQSRGIPREVEREGANRPPGPRRTARRDRRRGWVGSVRRRRSADRRPRTSCRGRQSESCARARRQSTRHRHLTPLLRALQMSPRG